ncbi:MAG TPA: T6SS immunity protein Tdi1 domain-containing protein [Pyrinomonadaceae bacterium]|nr:T6SS immunity protein Tdi1 domain-containing protein [Pyrinomonadaceae bacterium]
MNYSERLKDALGEKSACVQMPEVNLSNLSGKVSADFINLWQKDGLCGYGNGKFWIIDPNEVTPILPPNDLLPNGFVAFARDSFANIFLLVGDEIYRLDVHYGNLNHIAISTEFFFNVKIYDEDFREKFLVEKQFEIARQKLGDLASDECYTYKLALALGGSDEVENLTKVKFLEHLALLTQLNEE